MKTVWLQHGTTKQSLANGMYPQDSFLLLTLTGGDGKINTRVQGPSRSFWADKAHRTSFRLELVYA
jgi:hypothetical protein